MLVFNFLASLNSWTAMWTESRKDGMSPRIKPLLVWSSLTIPRMLGLAMVQVLRTLLLSLIRLKKKSKKSRNDSISKQPMMIWHLDRKFIMTPIKLSQVALWPIPKIHTTTHTYHFFVKLKLLLFLQECMTNLMKILILWLWRFLKVGKMMRKPSKNYFQRGLHKSNVD